MASHKPKAEPLEQLHFDGVEPTRMRQAQKPWDLMPNPTKKDVEGLRAFLRRAVAPGTVTARGFEELKKTAARPTITPEERASLSRLLDRWEEMVENDE